MSNLDCNTIMSLMEDGAPTLLGNVLGYIRNNALDSRYVMPKNNIEDYAGINVTKMRKQTAAPDIDVGWYKLAPVKSRHLVEVYVYIHNHSDEVLGSLVVRGAPDEGSVAELSYFYTPTSTFHGLFNAEINRIKEAVVPPTEDAGVETEKQLTSSWDDYPNVPVYYQTNEGVFFRRKDNAHGQADLISALAERSYNVKLGYSDIENINDKFDDIIKTASRDYNCHVNDLKPFYLVEYSHNRTHVKTLLVLSSDRKEFLLTATMSDNVVRLNYTTKPALRIELMSQLDKVFTNMGVRRIANFLHPKRGNDAPHLSWKAGTEDDSMAEPVSNATGQTVYERVELDGEDVASLNDKESVCLLSHRLALAANAIKGDLVSRQERTNLALFAELLLDELDALEEKYEFQDRDRNRRTARLNTRSKKEAEWVNERSRGGRGHSDRNRRDRD